MRKIIFYTIIFGLVGWSIASPVFALTVSPAKIEITADPGELYRGEIEIFNEQDSEKIFFTSYENFEPRGDTGAPYFIGAKDGLATWIETTDKVTIKSGERLIVPFSIAVPAGAEAGGYFAAIFFGSQPPQGTGGGEVTIGGKIGILVLLRVSGEVEESGGLLDFNAKNKQKFFSTLPITFEYRLNNTGGDRVVPVGEIKIKNTFRINSAKLLANENNGSVLPSSTRKFSVVWGEEAPSSGKESSDSFFSKAGRQLKDFHFGWYTASAQLTWGTTNQTASSSYNFFIIPWQLLLIIAIIALIIGFIGRIGLRRYNRFIIAQATQQPTQQQK